MYLLGRAEACNQGRAAQKSSPLGRCRGPVPIRRVFEWKSLKFRGTGNFPLTSAPVLRVQISSHDACAPTCRQVHITSRRISPVDYRTMTHMAHESLSDTRFTAKKMVWTLKSPMKLFRLQICCSGVRNYPNLIVENGGYSSDDPCALLNLVNYDFN